MPTYLCKIGTADGRVVEREFEAPSRELLRESLEDQGFSIFKVQARPFQFLVKGGGVGRRLGGRRFLSFNQELHVLLKSGMPIIKVLDALLERMEQGGLREALQEIRDDVRGGSSLSEAFEKFPRIFPHLYVASVKAGERTGDLPVTLGRYIAYQKRVEAIRAKVREAAFYPIILGLVTGLALAFLIFFVVPRFTQIYADAQTQLPLLTRILIAISKTGVRFLPLLLLGVVVAGFAGRAFVRTERGGLLVDRLKLRLPFFGGLQVDYALAAFCRTLGTILSSGIPLVQAMQMGRGTLNNRVLERLTAQATRRVEEGGAFSQSLEETGFFPVIALRMIGVGETTGALPEMLTDVADYYEAEVERRLHRLTTLIEPLMMLTMGLIIGTVVLGMYIPIFQLAGTVR